MNWKRIYARIWCFFHLVCVEHGEKKYGCLGDVIFLPYSGVCCSKCRARQKEWDKDRKYEQGRKLFEMATLAKGN